MKISIDSLHPLVLNVGLSMHYADWNWKNVSSPFTRIYYVTAGYAKIELSKGTYLLKPNHMYLIPAFTKHNCICESYFSHYYLHIYEEHQQGYSIYDEWDFPIEIACDKLDLPLIKHLCEINPHMKLAKPDPQSYDNQPTLIQNVLKNKQRSFYDKVESRGIVYQLLSRFIKHGQQKSKNQDGRIEKVLSYIHNHLYEPIELNTLAEIACLSKDHFIRLFKHETSTTPLQFINQKKIEKAQLLLVTEDMPVKDIAFTVGFDDYSYFNRLFRKMTGVTPKEYKHSYH